MYIYIPNDNKENYPFFTLQLMVKTFVTQTNEPTNDYCWLYVIKKSFHYYWLKNQKNLNLSISWTVCGSLTFQ